MCGWLVAHRVALLVCVAAAIGSASAGGAVDDLKDAALRGHVGRIQGRHGRAEGRAAAEVHGDGALGGKTGGGDPAPALAGHGAPPTPFVLTVTSQRGSTRLYREKFAP